VNGASATGTPRPQSLQQSQIQHWPFRRFPRLICLPGARFCVRVLGVFAGCWRVAAHAVLRTGRPGIAEQQRSEMDPVTPLAE
jgi:hypothetical protein